MTVHTSLIGGFSDRRVAAAHGLRFLDYYRASICHLAARVEQPSSFVSPAFVANFAWENRPR